MDDEINDLNDDSLWDILDDIADNKVIKSNKLICSGCQSSNIIYTTGRGSYVCEDCGTENQELFDENIMYVIIKAILDKDYKTLNKIDQKKYYLNFYLNFIFKLHKQIFI